MTKLTILAAALLTSTLATGPVLAKDSLQTTTKNMTHHQKMHKQARVQHWRNDRSANASMDRGYDRGANFENGDTGFAPFDAAEGIVGGAVDTAGAIVSAPFQDSYADANAMGDDDTFGDSYASTSVGSNWDNGDDGWSGQSMGSRSDFFCTPGGFTNSAGSTQVCQ